MNNIKKVGLTALGTALVASSAYAGDLSVTGAASITLVGEEQQATGNGWSMSDSVTFSGSAEMDNGWTVTASYELDGDDAGMDSRSIKIDMGDVGVLTFAGHGSSGAVNAVDDKTPNANEEAWALVTGNDGAGNGSATVDENWLYSNDLSAIDGLAFNATYQPSDASNVSGSVEVGDNVWIGPGVITTNGIRIGDGANITIGSVVIKDVDPKEKVAGNFAIPHSTFMYNWTKSKKK